MTLRRRILVAGLRRSSSDSSPSSSSSDLSQGACEKPDRFVGTVRNGAGGSVVASAGGSKCAAASGVSGWVKMRS